MGLIQKLTTAVRGGTREIIELAVDASGLRIFAQESHDCEGAIQQAKQEWCQPKGFDCSGWLRVFSRPLKRRSTRPSRHWVMIRRDWPGKWLSGL